MSLADAVTVSGGPGRRANQVGRCWRVIGVDLWAECPAGADRAVAQGRSVAERTHLKLTAFSAPEAGGAVAGDERARLWLRFVAREDDVYVTDEAICELLTGLAGRLRWSRLTKLEELDGAPAFAPLSSL
ncbi:MAG: hypothetical protein ACYCVN_11905 [Acidimicrobiales bacterium]